MFVVIVLAGPATGATVVYNTFGPGDSFNTSIGSGFGASGTPVPISVGNQFIPNASGTLASVTLAAGLSDTSLVPTSANSLRLEIWTNIIGAGQQEPGNLLEIATVDGQMGLFGQSVVSVPLSGNTSVNGGDPYWLVALPNPFITVSASGGWSYSEGSMGWTGQFLSQFAPFPPGFIMSDWVTQEGIQGTFRVEANVAEPPPIPIPAAFWLFGSAVAGFGMLGWRKRNTK